MMPVKIRVILPLALGWLDRLILTAVKVTLLFAAVVAFLPLIIRAGLRHLSQRRRSERCGR
jgi:hypothetical protein